MAIRWLLSFFITLGGAIILIVASLLQQMVVSGSSFALLVLVAITLAIIILPTIYVFRHYHLRTAEQPPIYVKAPMRRAISVLAIIGFLLARPTFIQASETPVLHVCRVTVSVEWPRYQFDGLLSVPDNGWGYVADGASIVDDDILVTDGITAEQATLWQVTNADGTYTMKAGDAILQYWWEDENGETQIGELIGKSTTPACSVEVDPSGENPPLIITQPPVPTSIPTPVVLPDQCFIWTSGSTSVKIHQPAGTPPLNVSGILTQVSC
jgi:hypothetical protein